MRLATSRNCHFEVIGDDHVGWSINLIDANDIVVRLIGVYATRRHAVNGMNRIASRYGLVLDFTRSEPIDGGIDPVPQETVAENSIGLG